MWRDESDTAVITYFEEKLLLRQVRYLEFEKRVKKLVYNSRIIKLKQLKESFAGNTNLELIVNDKDCLDWRLLFDDNFLAGKENEVLDVKDMEDDPNLCFNVQSLLLFGLLYC